MNWYYLDNFGNKKGPFNWDTLQSLAAAGKIHGNTQVIAPDGTTKSASKVPQLFSAVSKKPENNGGKIPLDGVLEAFRTTDYRKEIIPIETDNAYVIFSDPSFWVILILGMLPLAITSLQDTTVQLYGFLFFFAMLWGGLLRGLVLRSSGSVVLPIAGFFITGLIGLPLLLSAHRYLFPQFVLGLPFSPNQVISLFGFVFQVGISEELCKILPVLLYIIWCRKKTLPQMMLLIGVFSGLGFAAFENVIYAYRNTGIGVENFQEIISQLATAENEEQARQVVEAGRASTEFLMLHAMINTMCRSLSCVFGHSIWTGIFAYYLVCALSGGKRWVVFSVLGLAVPATLHGVYDWLCGLEPGFASLIVGASFLLFFGYLTKIRRKLLHPNI